MALINECQDYIGGGTQKNVYSSHEVVTVACPLCGSDLRRVVFTEHGAIGISRCLECSLLYTSPRVTSPEQVYWGDGEIYYAEARLIFEGKKPHHRDPNYVEELELIERFKAPGRFLDVGCNLGMLLRIAQKRGWESVGLDPSPSLSKLASKHGFKIYNCLLDELPQQEAGSFDVVALSDVFEHICEPLPFLKGTAKFLAPDGILFVKVPNGLWNLFKQTALALMGRKPTHGVWDSYEHVVHYTGRTLTRMLNEAGYDVFKVAIQRPVQSPVWHEWVGHYYQYPSPWYLDWKRHLGRRFFYRLSLVERLLRLGSIGYLAPNIVALARYRTKS